MALQRKIFRDIEISDVIQVLSLTFGLAAFAVSAWLSNNFVSQEDFKEYKAAVVKSDIFEEKNKRLDDRLLYMENELKSLKVISEQNREALQDIKIKLASMVVRN